MKPKRMIVKTKDVIDGNLWSRFPVINVDKVADIPCDYPGPMGVPITFIDKYDPDQFQLLGCPGHLKLPDGREVYQRIIVRNLHPVLPEEIDLAEWFGAMGVPLDVVMRNTTNGEDKIDPVYRGMWRGK